MDICKLSLLLPLLSAVMVTQVSANFWDAVARVGAAYIMYGGKREAEPQDSVKESVLAELAQNLAKQCKDTEGKSIDEDLAMNTLMNKFRQLDENGDVTLTGDELEKFQRFTAYQFCKKLEEEQQQKP